MKPVFVLLTLALGFFATSNPAPAWAQDAPQDRIIAKVNTDIITSGDVWSRYYLIQKSAGLPDNPQVRKEAFPQVLSTLIEEKLQMQEARKEKVSASEAEVYKGLEEIAKNNNTTVAKLTEEMKKGGLDIEELKRQTRAQVIWQKIIARVVRPTVDVRDKEVQKLADELNAKKGVKEAKIAEIQLPAADKAQEKDSIALAKRLTLEMQKGSRFRNVAAKFSIAASAKQGGLRGWVQAGELPANVEAIVYKMPKGALTDPIAADGKIWLILKLDERVGTGAPEKNVLVERIGTKKLEQAAFNYLKQLREDALIEFPGTVPAATADANVPSAAPSAQ